MTLSDWVKDNQLDVVLKEVSGRNIKFQADTYMNAPNYTDSNKLDTKSPVGVAKFFHKIAFGINDIDEDFFTKFIDKKNIFR